jgi:hypothetical protein
LQPQVAVAALPVVIQILPFGQNSTSKKDLAFNCEKPGHEILLPYSA